MQLSEQTANHEPGFEGQGAGTVTHNEKGKKQIQGFGEVRGILCLWQWINSMCIPVDLMRRGVREVFESSRSEDSS